MVCEEMTVQFSLSRMFQLVAVVAVLCSLFATVEWPKAMLLLAGVNAIAWLRFLIVKKVLLSSLAGTTSFLIWAALAYTTFDQLGSYTVVIGRWWPWWMPACISEFATVLCWLLSGSPSAEAKK